MLVITNVDKILICKAKAYWNEKIFQLKQLIYKLNFSIKYKYK